MSALLVVGVFDLLDGDHQAQWLVDVEVLEMANVDFCHSEKSSFLRLFSESFSILGAETLHTDTQLSESLGLSTSISEDLKLDLVSSLSIVDLPFVHLFFHTFAKFVDVHSVLSVELSFIWLASVEINE